MKELKRYLDDRIGEYSFYFEDIDSGYTYSFNERVKMPSASCIKIPIAMAVLKEAQDNTISLEQELFVRSEDKVRGSGIIHELRDREYTVGELITLMLVQSDNTAANKLIDLIGMEKLNRHFKNMELKETVLKRKMMDYQARERGLENLSTSSDLAHCLKILHHETFLNSHYSTMTINLLKKSQNRDKIPFYIPEREWKNIGNKTGSLSGIENDAAIINIKKGNFVFVVLSKSLPNNVYGAVTISRLGKMMWDIIDKNWK